MIRYSIFDKLPKVEVFFSIKPVIAGASGGADN
jgi:hypothetical protein